MVVCGSEVLGKPGTRKEAVAMLEKLSGRDHIVITGIALSRWEDGQAEEETSYERTVVSFKQLGKSEIHAYVASGEPLDKAGGYGIQGKGACLVQGIRGCYFNVVGLPLYRLCDMLKRWDYDIPW
jgi:septum formation protein